jgi:hypothetical protein
VFVPGPHNVNDPITYTHTITPDVSRIHPLYVYDQERNQLLGTGEYGPDLTGATAPFGVFGDGVDGDLIVTGVQYTDNTRTAMSGTSNSGQVTVNVASSAAFTVGHEVLIVQMQGTEAGRYEFGIVANTGVGTLTLQKTLVNTYTVDGNSKVQVLRVPHYRNVTVQTGGILTAQAWDGNTGGVVALRVSSKLAVLSNGTVSMDGKGYRGGNGGPQDFPTAHEWG